MEIHVGLHSGFERLGIAQPVLGGLEWSELFGGCAPGGQTGGVGFDHEPQFKELFEPGRFLGHLEMERGGEGFMELMDDPGAVALADLDEALELEALDGFAQHIAADAELSGQFAFGEECAAGGGLFLEERGCEPVTDLLDEGRRLLDGGNGSGWHGVGW